VQQTEEMDEAKINQLQNKVAELTRQHAQNTDGLGRKGREWEEKRGEDRKGREGEESRKKGLGQEDAIDRAVHEAALNMLRTIQREHILSSFHILLFHFILSFHF
jgi:hypothetical protein